MATDDVIRAADVDRESVVAILRDAFAAGRLTLAEFDERSSAAFAARTWGELRELTTDLPDQPWFGRQRHTAVAAGAETSAGPAAQAGPGRQTRAGHPAGDRWASQRGPSRLLPALPIAMIWLAIALFAHSPAAFVPIMVLLLIGLKSATGRGRGPGPPGRGRPF